MYHYTCYIRMDVPSFLSQGFLTTMVPRLTLKTHPREGARPDCFPLARSLCGLGLPGWAGWRDNVLPFSYLTGDVLLGHWCHLGDIKYSHMAVQASPPPICRTFSSSQTETMYPLNNKQLSIPPTPALAPSFLPSISVYLIWIFIFGSSRGFSEEALCP